MTALPLLLCVCVIAECKAHIHATISLLATEQPAYAAIAGHIARQELIVEAALTGRREPALAALATDPLVRDPATVAPMLDALLEANEKVMQQGEQ